MGKKSAHTGMSPKDISVNAMDKFISRNDRIREQDFQQLGRYKHEDRPVELWPLRDQLDYYDTNLDAIVYQSKYPSYSIWRDSVMDASKVYPSTFITFIYPHRELMKTMYAEKTSVREAVDRLRTLGVY
jgi:hypothetical protein